eukprot:TRINITY_DN4467_c0_g2_i12.p1 TRINITY_DN4467_c0_g2~~TRINITY_DN4467_c0_g2_i12.p1  ORF type:complete len:269 (-),score=27.65 TRINITY_DN4467_c0_g2_i12:927-1733(-)
MVLTRNRQYRLENLESSGVITSQVCFSAQNQPKLPSELRNGKIKLKSYTKKYRELYRDQIQEKTRKYSEKAGRDKVIDYMRNYRKENSKKIKEINQKRFGARRERIMQELVTKLEETKATLEELLNIRTPLDWYSVCNTHLKGSVYSQLFRFVKLVEFLKLAYPNIEWQEDEFRMAKKFSWKNRSDVRNFLQSIEHVLYIRKPEDWYRVSMSQLREVKGGETFLTAFGRIYNGVSFAFPEFPWVSEIFSLRMKKSSQKFVFPGVWWPS